MAGRERDIARFGLLLIFALLAVVGFHDVGKQYLDYKQVYGLGLTNIPVNEIILYTWYFLFGSVAVALLTLALSSQRRFDSFSSRLRRLLDWRGFAPLAAIFLFVEILLFKQFVLAHSPITDDESTYVFIAKTLLQGRLVNPIPPDYEFFKNQFIIINQNGWYGKYPIGHPLLLALGEAVHLRFLVVPLVTVATFIATYYVCRQLLTRSQGSLVLLLLLLSPHFVFMGAAELSHPTASLMMMLSLLALHKALRERRYPLFVLAGLFLGFGMVVRPFPGCLFVIAAGAYLFFGPGDLCWKDRFTFALVGMIPVLLAGGFLFWVNEVQTGDAMVTAYHQAQSNHLTGKAASGLQGVGVFKYSRGIIASSLGSALLRENFWLFAWPMSFVFVFFCRFSRKMLGVFAMIGAALVYRIIIPKTVVSTLGPVYLTEIVPLLVILSVAGIARLRNALRDVSPTIGRLLPSFLVSATVVGGLTFLPVQFLEIKRGAAALQVAPALIEKTAKGKALVFAKFMVAPSRAETWAYHPPNPSPTLDDDVIYVRPARGEDGPKRNIAFWKTHFPDRSAWIFQVGTRGAQLIRVEDESAFWSGSFLERSRFPVGALKLRD